MPPKPKLHKIDSNKNVSKSSLIRSPDKLDPDLQQQFEVELCWCIQQLQRTLNSGKLNKKQGRLDGKRFRAQGIIAHLEKPMRGKGFFKSAKQMQCRFKILKSEESKRTLNILMNNSTPFIKKRQVMRLTFGDYRHKMKEEDSKLSKVVTKISPMTPNRKSMFIRKSSFSRSPTNNNFTFNFGTEQPSISLAANISKIDLKSQEGQEISDSITFKFISSDNSFRFNFKNSV